MVEKEHEEHSPALKPPGRVQRRRNATKEHIFRTALDLFEKRGYEQTTVADITNAADVGKGTFFSYFPSKESIFAHLGSALTDDMDEMVAGRSSQSAASQIRDVFDLAAEWHTANRTLSQHVMMAVLKSASAMEEDRLNQQRFLELLSSVIQTGQARGEFRAETKPGDAALALAGIYFSVLLLWAQTGSERSLQAGFAEAIDIVFRGLAP